MVKADRIIMDYEGQEKGPLLIVIAAIHGNEQAGVRALRLVEKMLQVEPITNPSFSLHGKIVGLIGNTKAIEKGVRFIDQDLNRMWLPSNLSHILNKKVDDLNTEESELLSLLECIEEISNAYDPEELYILDLHTTSSGGGIFAIPNNDARSLEIAKNLHAPVVLDMLKAISGTTLHYFNKKKAERPITTSVTFEAGQHDDYLSVNRCIAAVVNCLKSINSVRSDDVENIHDEILISYSSNLPKLSRLLYKHDILPSDTFVMKPGYNNFDPVKEGDILAYDQKGEIKAKRSGLILMPLYQNQGNDGFFIIQPL